MKCKICGLSDGSEFYKGMKSYCKTHWKAKVKENRDKNKDHYLKYDRNRPNAKERNEKFKIANKERMQDDSFRVKSNLYKKQWSERNFEKQFASTAVGNAVRDGKLEKEPCEICGDIEVQGHHDDYSRPLEVRWLCVTHHAEHHKQERERKRGSI